VPLHDGVQVEADRKLGQRRRAEVSMRAAHMQ
jgi:hypothetical protein